MRHNKQSLTLCLARTRTLLRNYHLDVRQPEHRNKVPAHCPAFDRQRVNRASSMRGSHATGDSSLHCTTTLSHRTHTGEHLYSSSLHRIERLGMSNKSILNCFSYVLRQYMPHLTASRFPCIIRPGAWKVCDADPRHTASEPYLTPDYYQGGIIPPHRIAHGAWRMRLCCSFQQR